MQIRPTFTKRQMRSALRAKLLACLFPFVLSSYVPAGAAIVIAAPSSDAAVSLQSKYAALRDKLTKSEFQRPLYLESNEASGDVKSDIYALVDYQFPTVAAALTGESQWCEILILHLNVKECRASHEGTEAAINIYVGKKYAQPIDAATRMDFSYRVVARSRDYFEVVLNAGTGPVGTRDYLIRLEAVPLENNKTFVHLSYSYSCGLAARLALKTYLNTFGSDKVGFSVVGRRATGEPVYVGDVRGVLERNTMRYYLAIDAYLHTLSVPPEKQLEQRLREWYAATERYPLQLHELSESEYVGMKQNEYRRHRGEG